MVASTSLQNHFNGGLKTEFTGLNFPENACTDMDNCVISLVGSIARREGIDFESNYKLNAQTASASAINQYRWRNAGGDGETEILAVQIGSTLFFYQSSASTLTSPLSTQLLISTVNIAGFLAAGSTNTVTGTECQFADGNGYLFVYHPYCDPFYCTYNNQTITAAIINLQIRDFIGIQELGVPVNTRPSVLSPEHQYNLQNQGWTGNPSVSTQASAVTSPQGANTFSSGAVNTLTVPSGLSFTNGETLSFSGYGLLASNGQFGGFGAVGTVIGYTGTTLTVSLNGSQFGGSYFAGVVGFGNPLNILSVNSSLITTWFTDIGNYPSNADQWWEFKDDTNTFNPTTTIGNVTSDAGQAPQGFYILSAFNQDRSTASGVLGITPVSTKARPRTGTWFQGRVWYAGVDASQIATGDAQFYTWSENIYFSQIITNVTEFGECYENNDPTSENLFDELATDGGVITIPGCGSIYNLFPIQNGLIVRAANGLWLIRGNSGLGFTATDYSINKISGVKSISSTSMVDVNGLPMFWNEEGIYAVQPSKEQAPYGFGGLTVEPITLGTILSFYNNIPLASKQYARGYYNPVTYVLEWVYRSTIETDITSRYQYDSVLNLNTATKAFYPYSIGSNGNCYVHGIVYMDYPSGVVTPGTQPDPDFKYLTSVHKSGTWYVTFAEENDSTTWSDWFAYDNVGVDYGSFFMTGYDLQGKGLLKWLNTYVYMYSNNDVPSAYTIQGIWDYANTGDSGRYSNPQLINNSNTSYNNIYRRHKIRGHGMAFQLYINSVPGQPFSFFGWGMHNDVDASL